MRYWLVLATFSGLLHAMPAVTYSVKAGEFVGVRVLTAADADFDAQLSTIAGNPRSHLSQLVELKPFVLIVGNGSKESIARLTVRFELNRPGQKPVVWVHSLTTGPLGSPPKFTPGESVLAFPGALNVGNGYAAIDSQALAQQISELQGAATVSIMLDSLVFESGLIVGEDRSGASAQYRKPEQLAVRDLLGDLQHLSMGPDWITCQGKLEVIAATKANSAITLFPIGMADQQFQTGKMRQTLARILLGRAALAFRKRSHF